MLLNIIAGAAMIALGLAFLTRGYRWFRVLLPIWGFVVGFGVVASIVSAIFGQGLLANVIAFIPGLIIGLIFAVLSYMYYFFAVIFLCGSIGYALGAGLMSALGLDFWLISCPAGAVGAIIGVVIAFRANLHKYIPIVAMAAAGATLTLSGVLVLLGQRSLDQVQGQGWLAPIQGGAPVVIGIWAVLAIAGIVLQMQFNNRQIEYNVQAMWTSSATRVQ